MALANAPEAGKFKAVGTMSPLLNAGGTQHNKFIMSTSTISFNQAQELCSFIVSVSIGELKYKRTPKRTLKRLCIGWVTVFCLSLVYTSLLSQTHKHKHLHAITHTRYIVHAKNKGSCCTQLTLSYCLATSVGCTRQPLLMEEVS